MQLPFVLVTFGSELYNAIHGCQDRVSWVLVSDVTVSLYVGLVYYRDPPKCDFLLGIPVNTQPASQSRGSSSKTPMKQLPAQWLVDGQLHARLHLMT